MRKERVFQLLATEEIKGLKLFLSIFYLFLIAFDVIYYYVAPLVYGEQQDLIFRGLGYWYYILFLCLVPISIVIIKKGKVFAVKYIFLFGYIAIDLFNNFIIYSGTQNSFASGNGVELVFILFSILFINKRFFFYTLIGIISKYVVLGLVFQYMEVLLPIVLYSLLALLAYILLNRFYSNLQARLKLSEELQKSEQLAIVGQIATSITHEVRNPLTSLKGFTQLQKDKYPEETTYFKIMTEEIDRISAILNDLLVIGRPKEKVFERSDIKELIDYVESIMKHNHTENKVVITKEIDNDLPMIECNAHQIKQVFINIIKNGIEAMSQGGTLVIKAEHHMDNQIKITVTDEGEGISKENLNLLGNAFHTTKQDGTGLGLMASFKIMEEHQGHMEFTSEEGIGTTVTILLPVVEGNYRKVR
ncbi:ATP-binding protein [Radiobacillus sp. PE A8.2]|uniref:ATP-binding protein n=1 Tax=Radiobacillus sp. PE A8.2 TaxID=3380349 RepID=UPI00389095EC